MKLNHGLHLAYCTNVHRGEGWDETFASLQRHTLAVRQRVCPDASYAIGLRLGNQASLELSDAARLAEFQKWLEKNHSYVFTINGFPFGQFHGARVKENVYRPDWTSPERLAYTNRLFDLLSRLLPPGIEGSVSTLPGSFKEFITTPGQERRIRDNFWKCVEHIAGVSARTGRTLHLGVEPEPLGWFENTGETVRFFDQMRAEHPDDPRLDEHLGVNYDTCHFAVEFEEPAQAIGELRRHNIKISKLHLSSALKIQPTPEARQALAAFADDVYLHQVAIRSRDGKLKMHKDLAPALNSPVHGADESEWRIHFHVPLHSPGTGWYATTADHVTGVLDLLKADPALCAHLEMETYTWEVLPSELKDRSVVDQLAAEYAWTLQQLSGRGLANRTLNA
jgi:sugar phosphate isomerase/epimerase